MMNAMIAYANSAGNRWLAWIIAASLDSAALLALLALIWLAIRHRVAPQIGYGLFLLVPLKLLVPVVVTVPGGLAQWTPSVVVASWFQGGPPIAATTESQPPVKRPIAALGTDQPIRSETRFESESASEPLVANSLQSTSPALPRSGRQIATAASSLAHPYTEAPRLSVSATFMVAWLVGVLLLLGRLANAQRRFRVKLRHLPTLDQTGLPIDLRELCRRAGVPETVRFVESNGIAAPSVWGIVRPTIILPQGIVASLSQKQLRWVLLHELAHVRRRDLIVVTLQRLAAVLHFFNPAIWMANRIIHQLREYACDDLAASLSRSSAIESGEAFVRILRHADRRRLGLEGALGVFGLDSRACCLRRVHRLLDTDRPIRTAPGVWSLWGLILLAAVAVPHLRAAGDATPAKTQDPAKNAVNKNQADPTGPKEEAPANDSQEFELQVVGPGGKPIPEARVEVHTDPAPTAEQVHEGKLVRRDSYLATLVTDVQGRLAIKTKRAPTSFDVYITTPGYGPYWAGWSSESHVQPIPSRFTAELEPGWSVGGIVVDGEGKPVEGVQIGPSIEFKKRPGDVRQRQGGSRLKTDAAGKWRFDSVPVSMGEVFVEINHPGFRPVRRPLTLGEFGIERGGAPAARVVLDRGAMVTGTVTDEAGKPIVGALVRTKFLNDIRAAITGNDGIYRLLGCEPRAARIVVSAQSWATDMKELNIDSDMGPVDFKMKPGGTVRIRVVDAQGQAVAKVRIFFQSWRGPFKSFEFNHVSQFADKNGIWVWSEAPLDEFKADICPPDGMSLPEQPLIARAEEYVFRLPPPLVVSGKVLDAETKLPIMRFRVVPGVRSSATRMNWVRSETYSASDGQYQFHQSHGYFAHMFRIEADGYRTAVSRDIKSAEGKVAIDFELKKAKDIVAKVVTPQNISAIGAKVALGIAGSQININNGDIDDGSTYSSRQTTDETGRFQFPAQDTKFQLVITHASGFAHIRSTPDWELTRIIHLEPWSKVEGTFRIGKAPAINVPLSLDVSRVHSYGEDVPSIFNTHYVTTGPGGRFVFERVIPGTGRIGRRLMLTVNDGAADVTSSCTIAAEFPAGKTVHIDLGGNGRAVICKLLPADGFRDKVRWSFALVDVRSDANDDRSKNPHFTATVDRDGTFRIDDMPTGDYVLRVSFQRDDAGHLLNYRFNVPPQAGAGAAEPVDLGPLKLTR
jgi:beta-lactamase regulating signal transducer with metallopeptidase domain